MVFYWFWIPSGTSFFIKQLEKQSFGMTRSGHQKRVRKKYDFWEAGTAKSEPPCRREHDLEVLSNSRKELYFGGVFVPPFGSFGVSYRRKHCLERCLNFVHFLHGLLYHFRPPKWPPNHKIHFWNHFLPTFLAWEREARLIMRVLPTYARSSHRPSQNLRIFQYA